MKFNRIMMLLASVLVLGSCSQTSESVPSVAPVEYNKWSDAFKDTFDGGERAIISAESSNVMPVTMAIIDEVVPYFDAPDYTNYNNWELSKTLLSNYPSGAYIWGIGYSYFWSSSSAVDEEVLDEEIASVLEGVTGWSYDDEALEWRYTYSEEITIALYHGFIPSGSGYVLGVLFDLYYEPHSWADYYVNYVEQEETYSYATKAAEIEEYIPYFQYEFNSIFVTVSTYSPGYKVWGLAKLITTASEGETIKTQITNLFEDALLVDPTFVKENDVYSKTVSDELTIHVRIQTYDDAVAILFDAYVPSKGTTSSQSWSRKFDSASTQISNAESTYNFAIAFNQISVYIPYIDCEYTGLAAFSSEHSDGEIMWGFCMSSDEDDYQNDSYEAIVSIYNCFKDQGWTYDFTTREFSKTRGATNNIDYVGVNYTYNVSTGYVVYIYIDSATITAA